MVVKFVCTTDDKQKYHKIKELIFFSRSTIMREKIRERRDEYFAECEVISYGRFLYREIKASGLCNHLRLDPNLVDDEE